MRAAPVLLLLVGLLASCKRKHVAVDSVTDLGYPTCVDAPEAGGPGALLLGGALRSGPDALERDVVERFQLSHRACHLVFTARQEWPITAADVEVIYDEQLAPLRAWKRLTIPGSPRPDGHADIRSYELRTPEVTIKRRGADGVVSFEILKPGGGTPVAPGARVAAVVGPGRGLVSVWLRRAKLAAGAKVKELVLDFRDMVERLELATLERNADLFAPWLGRTVRVYTLLGKDTVFADDDDVVIGDLAGMRPAASVTTPAPPPLPTYGGADPVNTP